jgi:predicted PurR-regulated permease PerM
LVGTLGTGIVQGVLAALGFWITGVPEPLFFGAATTVASLVLETFAALLGGVQVFGLKGLIVGPMLMSLAVAVLRLYATEARKRRADLVRP